MYPTLTINLSKVTSKLNKLFCFEYTLLLKIYLKVLYTDKDAMQEVVSLVQLIKLKKGITNKSACNEKLTFCD